MSLSSEAALMLLALALYIYDALMLLDSNEAVLVRKGQGWRVVFGAFHWRLAGREPCIPGFLAPHRSMARLAWQFIALPASTPRKRVETGVGLGGVALCTTLSALTLFVLLPICLFVPLADWMTLLVIGLLYGINLTALVLLYRVRRRLQVPALKYWLAAFECLVCPPFCINLMRRISEWESVDEDLLQACRRLLPPETLATVHAQCLMRLDEQIAFEDEDSPRMTNLQQMRARLLSSRSAS